MVDEGVDVPPFLSPKGASGSFEKAFDSNWGIKTQDFIFGDSNVSKDWFFKSPTFLTAAK